jgi:hypothetical protein
VLNEKRSSEFVVVAVPEEDNLLLTDYHSLRDFQQLQELNVRIVVNLAANLCFNYYLNDLEYEHFYLPPLPTKPPADAVLFENNIEHLLPALAHSIIVHTAGNKPGDPHRNRVALHSAGAPFSDENIAVVIGYLILRYLYSFEKAFERVGLLY